MFFDDFLRSIFEVKRIPLPGESSQFKMSPPFRRELMRRQKEQMKNPNRAGVLALFYPDRFNETRLVLILRKTYPGVHSGQVGFPGGKLEAGDKSLREAAIRETHEEIGISTEHIEVVRALTDLYIPPSNFYVQPFIALTRETPDFVAQEDEIDQIIEVRFQHFFDDTNVIASPVSTSYNVTIEVPAFHLNNHIVWGATAMMLSEIKDLLKAAI